MKEHYKENSLQLAYYKQTVNKNAMLRQTVPSIDKIYQQDFLKGRSLPFVDSLSAELRQTSILLEVSKKPISAGFTK